MDTTQQHWSAAATTDAVPRLRRDVTAFALDHGVAGTRLDDLRACLSEAVTNAVLHAFRDGRGPGTINVSAGLGLNQIVLTVSDDGTGYSPRLDSPGLGIGISLLTTLCESMSIGPSSSGGTEVTMVLPVQPRSEPGRSRTSACTCCGPSR